MRAGRLACLVMTTVLAVPGGSQAQSSSRLWGRVETADGSVHEGFIRWDRDQAGWWDLLTGTRPVPTENLRIWRAATGRTEELPRRVVEVGGFRVSWPEDDPDFPSSGASSVRFGQVREIRPAGPDAAELVLRNGEALKLSGGGTDLGADMRGLAVEVPGGSPTEFGWEEVTRIVLDAAPGGVEPESTRLHGTVTDRWGNRYTGDVTWDRDEVLASDVLNGVRDGRGGEVSFSFSDIEALERTWEGTRISLRGGGRVELSGSNDVGRGHRGVRVSDPGLGRVDIPWDEFESLRLHAPAEGPIPDPFRPGERLRGTVTTRSGQSFSGRILWDADEAWSWEALDGSYRGVAFQVEFGMVESVSRRSSRSADVVLRDGRRYELDGSNDVGEENRGILVLPDGDEAGEWVLVTWDELAEARFDHDEG